MRSLPLYVVRHFNGTETRMISKHLHSEAAFKMANMFMNNLKDKLNKNADKPFVVSITKAPDATLFSITNRDHGPSGEGVRITLESQKNPYWDYPQYSDPRESDSGHVTTAGRHSSTEGEGE